MNYNLSHSCEHRHTQTLETHPFISYRKTYECRTYTHMQSENSIHTEWAQSQHIHNHYLQCLSNPHPSVPLHSLSLNPKNMGTIMLKLIRWLHSTSLLHRSALKPHSDWTWQLSLSFLCLSRTVFVCLFVSFLIQYASTGMNGTWTILPKPGIQWEFFNIQKKISKSLYTFIHLPLFSSLSECVRPTSDHRSLHVKLVSENRSDAVMCLIGSMCTLW